MKSGILKVLILGVGSPFGDDRLGWIAAEMLQRSPAVASGSGTIAVSMLDRPGAMLMADCQGADAVILMDAVRSGTAPGTLHCLDADELAAGRPMSCHGFGVASALELGRALGDLPGRIYLYGIEMDPAHAGPSVSPAVLLALPALVNRIEKEARRLTGEAVTPE